ncbi:LuxR C-terminal-related transcriptional regulator [Delftia sp. PS-11]|uniref:LuxR C-terminal-related transcriptional regulator n=1 Tax=Delftia sp. PS-11 TaxID=2767222 RepID=UPI003AB5BDD7
MQSIGRTLVIEDDPHFGAWVVDVLRRQTGFGTLDWVGSLQAARRQMAACWPALTVIDLHLPDGCGVDLIREMLRMAGLGRPSQAILVLTAVDDAQLALKAMRAGAHGYIVKNTSETQLLQVLQDVLDGGSPITPSIARLLLREFQAGHNAEVAAAPACAEMLSARESEILELLSLGYRNKEIARRKDLSPHTVNSHVRNIYRKLSVNSRSELRAVLHGGDSLLRCA